MEMEPPAVKEGKAITFPHFLAGGFIRKDDKWVMLVAGSPTGAPQFRNPMEQGHALHFPFPGMTPIEMDEIQAVMIHVQAGRQDF